MICNGAEFKQAIYSLGKSTMKYINSYCFSLLPALLGLAVMYFAFAHYELIDNLAEYKASKLIRYEFILLLLGFLFLLGVLLSAIINLSRRNWKFFGINVLGLVLGYLLLSFAMSLDRPTLIFIT